MKLTEWEPKIKCTKSIIFKIAFVLVLCLFIVISIFSYFNVKLTEKRLIGMAANEASKTSDAIKNSLEKAMISNEQKTIQSIIETVGNEASIEDIKILDAAGKIKYAKNKAEIGTALDRTKISSCNICHSMVKPPRENLTIIFTKNDGNRLLRNVNPIDNKAECLACHGSSQQTIGKLLVDFNIKDTDKAVMKNKIFLIISASASVLTIALVSVAVLLILIKPRLHGLTKKIKETAGGNYDVMIKVKGTDEISLLSTEFNNMIKAIKERDAKIKDQLNIHTTLFNISSIVKRASSLEEDISLILNALNMGLNIQQCTFLLIKPDGSVDLKGYIGMSEEKADLVRLTIEELFDISKLPVSKERQEIATVIEEKDKIISDEVFIARGNGKVLEDFAVVPLKAGNTLLGVITIHKIKEKTIDDPEIKNFFSIISTAIAPYVFIGASMDRKTAMQSNPFESFLKLIQEHIDRVEEYQGYLSLVIVRADNYGDLVSRIGIKKASERIKDTSTAISLAIEKVHEVVRISEDMIAIILPMIDKSEAREIIEKVVVDISDDIAITSKISAYPENGTTPEEIVHSAIHKGGDIIQ